MESQISIPKRMIFDLKKIDFRPANKLNKALGSFSFHIAHRPLVAPTHYPQFSLS
ncbi:hypothetical protein [Hoylesella nanceiensis]|uniref:hypothetical protein n=1 Tax=Hoylesella nanceiensis TaxID=425941 RepID=UPI001CAE2486|nr:hypothetical protein [Hoylesella nanceiensis]MBF1426767.1 hypothetical protein [Hoylesella nanceiensis]